MLEKKKNRVQKGSNDEERNQIEKAQMNGQTTKEWSNNKRMVKRRMKKTNFPYFLYVQLYILSVFYI